MKFFSNLLSFLRYSVKDVSNCHQLADIVLVPKDGGNVIRPELWAEAERLVEAIALIEVTVNFFLASTHHHLGLF